MKVREAIELRFRVVSGADTGTGIIYGDPVTPRERGDFLFFFLGGGRGF